ncbi:MAG TPA: amidohydrolase family protein [Acidimicrobiia bacterium]|nr:amidohydrolase family protein [Acidimicrobiia bacterium]
MAEPTDPPIWDVHAHHLPEAALAMMGDGAVQVRIEVVGDKPESITVNGMAVGATIGQLADPAALLAATDAAGIDRRVISPPPFTYRYWDEPENTLRLHRLLNEATAELVAAHPDRFVGLASVPLQHTEQAIAEAVRARDELGLVGVTLGTNVAGGNVDDPERRPFLAAVADAGMPVLIHPDFVPNPRTSKYYLVNLIGMPVESTITMANMLFSGLFEELPALRVCFVHGGGAAPFLLGRWDKGWRVRPEARSGEALPPSARMSNVFCDTLTHSPVALAYLVEVLGESNVVIGTDLPFDVEDANPRAHLRAAPRLTPRQINVIETESPVRWLTGSDPA